MNTEDFIKKAIEIHGNRYDYSKVEYINSATKVCIICPKHGLFYQSPYVHLKGSGCPKCAMIKNSKLHKSNTDDFIKRANSIHSNKYDYSKVEYINSNTKVCIICPEHGEFEQTPSAHLSRRGCPKCIGRNKSIDDFIAKSKEIHNNKYDYSKVEYINTRTKVNIICPKHGEFIQMPMSHMAGAGCPKCSGNKRLSTKEFVEKAKKIHGSKYDYSKVEYINAHTKIRIICPEHGEFWQTAYNHLQKNCCPFCSYKRIKK